MGGGWWRRAGSWVWLVVLLAGPPTVLVVGVGWPLPRRWPDAQAWQRWLAGPVSGRVVADAAAVGVWLLWALLVYAVVVDVARRVRRAPGRVRLPALPTRVQAVAGGLVGAAVFGVSTHGASPPPSAGVPAVAADPDTAVTPQVVAGAREPLPLCDERVGLPGGWVSHHTAAEVARAASLVWWQRRRRYRPGTPTRVDRADPDLAPLPAAVTAAQAWAHPLPDAAGAPAGAVVAAGPGRTGVRLLLPADLPPGGVGLTGPAALDAARGILVAALLTPDAAAVRVVTTTADADLLLAGVGGSLPAVPGLLLADGLNEAVAAVEDVAWARAGRATPSPTNPQRPDSSLLVLIVGRPTDPVAARRVAALLTVAAAHHIIGVLLGPWPAGRTWSIAPGGVVWPDGHGRISVLDAATTRDLLTVYQQAHTLEPLAAQVIPAPPRPAPTAAAARRAGLWLQTLGVPAVYAPGADAPVRLPRSAALPLLVLLALHPDGVTATDLATALWPRLHPHTTTGRIYTTVSSTRRVLDPLAAGPIIVRTGERYRLNPHNVGVDLWDLHTAIDLAAAGTNTDERDAALRRITDGYTGDLGEGWSWPWLDAPREALYRHHADARAALAQAATATPRAGHQGTPRSPAPTVPDTVPHRRTP